MLVRTLVDLKGLELELFAAEIGVLPDDFAACCPVLVDFLSQPLPIGWEVFRTDEGRLYFVYGDHSQWERPGEQELFDFLPSDGIPGSKLWLHRRQLLRSTPATVELKKPFKPIGGLLRSDIKMDFFAVANFFDLRPSEIATASFLLKVALLPRQVRDGKTRIHPMDHFFFSALRSMQEIPAGVNAVVLRREGGWRLVRVNSGYEELPNELIPEIRKLDSTLTLLDHLTGFPDEHLIKELLDASIRGLDFEAMKTAVEKLFESIAEPMEAPTDPLKLVKLVISTVQNLTGKSDLVEVRFPLDLDLREAITCIDDETFFLFGSETDLDDLADSEIEKLSDFIDCVSDAANKAMMTVIDEREELILELKGDGMN